MKRVRALLILMLTLVIPVASLSKSTPRTPVDRGEGIWGANGQDKVRIFDIDIKNQYWGAVGGAFGSINGIVGPKAATGGLRNLTDQPFHNIVITIGEHEDGDTIIYGADRLDATEIDKSEVWRWSVNPNKGAGYEVLKVTVDGQALTRLRQ